MLTERANAPAGGSPAASSALSKLFAITIQDQHVDATIRTMLEAGDRIKNDELEQAIAVEAYQPIIKGYRSAIKQLGSNSSPRSDNNYALECWSTGRAFGAPAWLNRAPRTGIPRLDLGDHGLPRPAF